MGKLSTFESLRVIHDSDIFEKSRHPLDFQNSKIEMGNFLLFLHIFLFSDYDTSPETTTSLISFTWVETDTYWQIEWKNFESVYCQTPNLGLGLGVDFTFPNRGLKFGTQTKLAIVSSW